jgi:nitronate monooxygenase
VYLAAATDDFSTRVIWAGEGVDLIDDIPSASDIIERVVADAVVALRDCAALIRSA